ncbi:MAG: hypothetical protein ACYC0H_18590 [Solirubrobacteraceae bacterium]
MSAGTGLQTIQVAGRGLAQPPEEPERQHPVFYFDLAHPDCYLAAERITEQLPVMAEWEPVYGPQLGIAPPPLDSKALAAAAQRAGLQPLRAPATWPPDSRLAMLTATYAKTGGKTVAFSLAAFRQTFAGGRELSDEGTVLIAAAACEIHPRAVLKGVGLRSTADALARACSRARSAGVRMLPAIEVRGTVFEGPHAVKLAAAALADAA